MRQPHKYISSRTSKRAYIPSTSLQAVREPAYLYQGLVYTPMQSSERSIRSHLRV